MLQLEPCTCWSLQHSQSSGTGA